MQYPYGCQHPVIDFLVGSSQINQIGHYIELFIFPLDTKHGLMYDKFL